MEIGTMYAALSVMLERTVCSGDRIGAHRSLDTPVFWVGVRARMEVRVSGVVPVGTESIGSLKRRSRCVLK